MIFDAYFMLGMKYGVITSFTFGGAGLTIWAFKKLLNRAI